MKEAFAFLDRDRKGYFTAEDFKLVIGDQHMSFGGPNANFADVIQEAFPGKENITFEEFITFMREPVYDDTLASYE